MTAYTQTKTETRFPEWAYAAPTYTHRERRAHLEESDSPRAWVCEGTIRMANGASLIVASGTSYRSAGEAAELARADEAQRRSRLAAGYDRLVP